ncbi:MAG: SprT family zinc-dependent metalloprotease [Woeseiaceae bacterium]|nr:SprT family zinc-dependent metalloprotease [Woeseiaceae bacterium]
MSRPRGQLALFDEAAVNHAMADLSVRESGRARRLSIKVYPRGRVEVVVPKRTRAADVEAFVLEHREWIERTRQHFFDEHPPEPFRLPEQVDLVAVGRRFDVRYRRKRGATGVRFRQLGSTVVLTGAVDDEEACVGALRRWLAGVAKEEFGQRLLALSSLTGLPYERIQVRAQKTCWGSHSSTGTISLNYCLLFLEPELLRYLMIHELCHARHMNHSPRFWQLVGRFDPHYRDHDKRLSSAWQQIPIWVGIY